MTNDFASRESRRATPPQVMSVVPVTEAAPKVAPCRPSSSLPRPLSTIGAAYFAADRLSLQNILLDNENSMRHFLDTEFNGFGGPLVSLALVPEDRRANSFYEALPCAEPNSWVAEHVLPVLQTRPVSRPKMVKKLAAYLTRDSEPVVVADWPSDIAQMALLMITGPGYRMPLPRLMFELLDLPLFDSAVLSEVPHNACYDAIALRDYVLAEEQPFSRRREV